MPCVKCTVINEPGAREARQTHLIFVLWTSVLYGLNTNKSVSYLRNCVSFCSTCLGHGYVACVCTVSSTRFAEAFALRVLGNSTAYR